MTAHIPPIQQSLTSLPLRHAIHKVGEINKNARIWIANKSIEKSFSIGQPIFIKYLPASGEIIVEEAELLSNHSISSRENSKGRTPILDIKNSSVTETFGDIEKVEVLYYPGKIVIRATKNEKLKKERKEKGLSTLFELFSGGGTLTHHIKKSFALKGHSLRSVGALEMSEQYLTMYEDNNREEKITICSTIEDIHPSDYPQADIILAGIPCTTFTNANLLMNKAIKNNKSGVATQEDNKRLAGKTTADSLVFYVLNAIFSVNAKIAIIEEVENFSKSSSADLLRTVLLSRNYTLSETILKGLTTKRKRWCMVATMGEKVDLENLMSDDGSTIAEHLEIPASEREWQTPEQNKRIAGAIRKKSVGVRAVTPEDTLVNTFTTHGTRSSEPCLVNKKGGNLYSEFTNKEIANIHGLSDYKLSGQKTLDRRILGQGTTNSFLEVGERIINSFSQG